MIKSIVLLVLVASVNMCSAQELDSFFKNDRAYFSIYKITNYYNEKDLSSEATLRLVAHNSKILKDRDYYIYLMNEFTRIKLLSHSNDVKKAHALLEKLENDPFLKSHKKLLGYYNNTLGNLYFSMQYPDKGQIYFRKAVEIFSEIKDSVGLKANLINMGNSHGAQSKEDSAFYFYSRAWHLDSLGIKEYHVGLMSNLARYYLMKNQIEKATEMYEDLYFDACAKKNNYSHVVLALNLGDCYFQLKQYDRAILVLNDGKQISVAGSMEHTPSFNYYLSECYSELGKFEEAYILRCESDSLGRKEGDKKIADFVKKLELKHQKELHIKEELIYKEAINRKKSEQRMLVIFLISSTILLLFILYLYFQKRKKNEQLAKQNFKLVEQYVNQKGKKVHSKKISTELIKRIEVLFYTEKIFRDSELTLDKLAKLLEINRTYVSETINAHFGNSFRVVLNKLRIDDARYMLVSDEFEHYSIEGIAISSGYRNLSSFNVAFKKETGITPSYFKSQNR